MSAFTVFSTSGAAILAPFLTFSGASAAVATVMIPILVSGLTINIMWHGYETMRGRGGPNAFLDVCAMSVRVGLVMALGLTAYTANVVGLINEVIGWLSTLFATAGAVTGSGLSGSVTPALTALDASCQIAVDSMSRIWDVATGTGTASGQPSHITIDLVPFKTDFSGVMMITQGLVMLLAFSIYACIAAFELLYIQIALLIFYAIGPLFIAAYAFKSTEHFFSSWLKGICQFAITAVVIAMCIGLGNSILSTYVARISTNLAVLDFLQLGVASLVASIMLILVVTKVPELATHIVGGISVSSAAFAAGRVADSVNRATGSMPGGPNPFFAGLGRGLGASAAGAGSGIGSAAAGLGKGVGAFAAGLGKGAGQFSAAVGNRFSGMVDGTGRITGSNTRPPGQSIKSMLGK